MPNVFIGANYSVNMNSSWLQSYYTAHFSGGTLFYGGEQYSNAYGLVHSNGSEIWLWGSFRYAANPPHPLPFGDSVINAYELRDSAGNLIVYMDKMPAISVSTFVSWWNTGDIGFAMAQIDALLDGKPLHIEGGNFNDVLVGHTGNDEIWGEDGNDNLQGGDGNDYLDGGNGIDTLFGGSGNDRYIIRAGDSIVEGFGQGTDTAYSHVTYALPANVEDLHLFNGAAINGTGNNLPNRIFGNTSANVLSGQDGNDKIDGGKGNDKLYGDAGNDSLVGGEGNDLLDGGIGRDTLVGGAGNDTFIVDAAKDVVKELAGQGTDIIKSSANYKLPDHVEKLTLTGSGNINGTGNSAGNVVSGNGGNNKLAGGGGNDTLIGGAGNDVIDGGPGNDSMVGGRGDDLYTVDAAGDRIKELAGQGIDTVRTSLAFTLGDHLDNLVLTGGAHVNGTGNTLDNAITGNGGNNVLNGGAGNDTLLGGVGKDTLIGGGGADFLDGGTGADSMRGDAGDDVYVTDAAGDKIKELAGKGIDTVQSSVTRKLEANVENLILTGGADLNGTGNGLDNAITGNSGHNVLSGGGGMDMLSGGDGNDTLLGGAGDDTLDGGAGADILDGGEGNDTLAWDAADAGVDGGLGTDTLRILGDSVILDLRAVSTIASIEVIDLVAAAGSNHLQLEFQDVLDLSETNSLNVNGDAGDVVHRGTGWTDAGTEMIEAVEFLKFTQGDATLRINSLMTTEETYLI